MPLYIKKTSLCNPQHIQFDLLLVQNTLVYLISHIDIGLKLENLKGYGPNIYMLIDWGGLLDNECQWIFLFLLNIVSEYKMIKGVIIGNLSKDKTNSLLNKQEVKKFKVGNFSGKPCEPRSNELIKLTYKKYGDKLIIIGCGGVFNGQDAYTKIKLGASLIQLITGMIYQGPQLISQINLELEELLEKDGFTNIKQAVGIDVK